MMDVLINFEEHGHLFCCASNEFNVTIKKVLSNILIHETECTYTLTNGHGVRKIKCIICLQIVYDDGQFVICDECCRTCINQCTLISVTDADIFICRITSNDYWDDLDSCSELAAFREGFYKNKSYHNKRSLLKHFVDCSHKLIHRFYHSVSILFLLSLYDSNSHCNILNVDVVTYIFNFIY